VRKQEGDKRAPAGLFSLGTAFGRIASPPPGVTFPYRQATSDDYFVDAPESPLYNTWVHLPKGEKMETSAEQLLMYKWGLVVNHNTSPPQKGAGSAIFLHVWKDKNSPTVGCTALAEEDLLTIFRWLDEQENPLLLQVADHLYP
jgi:L,D-peptidoglycan transpeptidase YkuD (ErfK/YbiS/YcfS/YnhG family)